MTPENYEIISPGHPDFGLYFDRDGRPISAETRTSLDTPGYRFVARTVFPSGTVSTIWTGASVEPFEIRVSRPGSDEAAFSCPVATLEYAMAGHARAALAFAKESGETGHESTLEEFKADAIMSQGKIALAGAFFDREGNPIGFDRFKELDADPAYRIIEETEIGAHLISTVWDGHADHRYRPPAVKHPMVFATAVLGPMGSDADLGPDDRPLLNQFRYATAEDARQGHESIVADWRTRMEILGVDTEPPSGGRTSPR